MAPLRNFGSFFQRLIDEELTEKIKFLSPRNHNALEQWSFKFYYLNTLSQIFVNLDTSFQNFKLGFKSRGRYKVSGYQVKVNLDGSKSKFLE